MPVRLFDVGLVRTGTARSSDRRPLSCDPRAPRAGISQFPFSNTSENEALSESTKPPGRDTVKLLSDFAVAL